MTIKKKFVSSFLFIAILVLINAIVGIFFLNKVAKTGYHVSDVLSQQTDAVMEMKISATTAHLWFEQRLGGDTSIQNNAIWKNIAEAKWYGNALLKGGENQEGKFYPLTDSTAILKTQKALYTLIEFEKQMKLRIELIGSKNKAQLEDVGKKIDELFKIFTEEAEASETLIQKFMKAGKAEMHRIGALSDLILIILTIISFIISLLFGLIISSRFTSVIRKITEGAKKIALGNLHQDAIIVKRKDELGELSKDFNILLQTLQNVSEKMGNIASGDLTAEIKLASNEDEFGKSLTEMVSSLNLLIGEVQLAVEQVSAGATQISSTSQDLSGGASEQASSIEEISATIEEINSQAKLNSENTTQSVLISKGTLDIAAKGNEKMDGLLKAMLRIDESATRIKKVVKFIDDIAFQINLLALNANVEAARAGKYGKGFAVVADEVRNLAVKSAGSVKETESMVEETIKNIAVVQSFVNDAVSIFGEISNGSAKTSELLEEVSLATNEQANGLDEISKGIVQIDSVTQSNTANAEETAASSEELSSQANQLKILVERFKLKKSKALPLPDNKHINASSTYKSEKTVSQDNKATANSKKSSVSVIALDDDHEIF